MATINIGGRTVEVPDNLDLPGHPARSLRNNVFGDAAAQTANPRTIAPQITPEPIGQNPGMTGNPANNELLRAAQQRIDPVQTAARNAAWPQAPQPIGPNNPAFHGDGRYGAPPNPVMEAPTAGRTSLRAGVGAAEGTLGKVGYAAGRGVQAVANSPVGGLVKGALNPAAIAGSVAVGHFNDYKLNDPGVDSSLGGTLRAFVQDKKDQMALPPGDPGHLFTTLPKTRASLGKGALETGMDLGSAVANVADLVVPGKAPISSWYDRKLRETFGDQLQPHASVAQATQGVQSPVPSSAKSIPTDFRRAAFDDPRRVDLDPSRQSLGASRDFTRELSAFPEQLPGDLRSGVINKTVGPDGRVTYSGNNVAGGAQTVDGMGRRVSGGGTVNMLGGQPGDATPAERLAQIERDTLHAREMNGLRAQLMDRGAPPPGVYMFSGETLSSALRKQSDAQGSLSILDERDISAMERATLKQNERNQNLQAATTRRGQDMLADTTRHGQNLTYAGQTRGQDIVANTALRGQDMDLQSRILPKQMEIQLAQRMRALRGQALMAAKGDPTAAAEILAQYGDTDGAKFMTEQSQAAQTRGEKTAAAGRDRLKHLATELDPKTGLPVINEAKLASVMHNANSMAPQFSTASAEDQAAMEPTITAGEMLRQGMNSTQNNSRWDNFWGNTKAERTKLDLRGAKAIGPVGMGWDAIGPRVSMNDIRLRLGDGTEAVVPRSVWDNQNVQELVAAEGKKPYRAR